MSLHLVYHIFTLNGTVNMLKRHIRCRLLHCPGFWSLGTLTPIVNAWLATEQVWGVVFAFGPWRFSATLETPA